LYKLYIKPRAEKDILALPKDYIPLIRTKILSLANDPYPKGWKKIKGKPSCCRIRQGPYRILYEVDQDNNILTILAVPHRGKAYRD